MRGAPWWLVTPLRTQSKVENREGTWLSDLHLLDEIGLDPQSGIAKVQDQYGATLYARLKRRAEAWKQGDAEVDDVYQDALIRLIDPRSGPPVGLRGARSSLGSRSGVTGS